MNTRKPINPEAHKLLTDQGAAILVHQGEADFDDGDAENGPGFGGHPEYDRYQSESHDIAIDWRGMSISLLTGELDPDDWDWPEPEYDFDPAPKYDGF